VKAGARALGFSSGHTRREGAHYSMKMLAEYVESAIKFEKMAAQEKDPKLKAEFEKQAMSYRKLAEKRAKEYGLNMPPERK
jgi:hypothetical protein